MSKNPSKISNIAESSLDELPESGINSIIDPKIDLDFENSAILPDPGTPNFSSNSMRPVSPLTPLIGNKFVRLDSEEGRPFYTETPGRTVEMDRLLFQLTKQEIEKEELIRMAEFLKQKKLIDSLIKDVQQGEYEKLDNFFKEKPEYSEYKEIINDLIKTRKERMKNKEEQEKIATSNTPKRTRSSGRVTKKNPRYERGGKKSKSKKKRLVKTKRKKHKN